jgi:hypothetical protein
LTIFAWFMVTSTPAPALAGITKAAAASSAATGNSDLDNVIEQLPAGGFFNGT